MAARVYDLRAAGLNVTTIRRPGTTATYRISSRDMTGSRAKVFA